jgi:hypothetical protein
MDDDEEGGAEAEEEEEGESSLYLNPVHGQVDGLPGAVEPLAAAPSSPEKGVDAHLLLPPSVGDAKGFDPQAVRGVLGHAFGNVGGETDFD